MDEMSSYQQGDLHIELDDDGVGVGEEHEVAECGGGDGLTGGLLTRSCSD